MREDPAQPLARDLDQLGQKALAVAVDVAEEGEVRRVGPRLDPVRDQIVATVATSTTKKRATCSRSKRPNGTSAFPGSAQPGTGRHAVASSARSSSSRPSATGARIRNVVCGVISG